MMNLLRKLFNAVVNESFDRLRTNGNFLIPFVESLSNHNGAHLIWTI